MAIQAEFFKLISLCWESQLVAYHSFSKPTNYNHPHQLSILHVAAQQGIPAIVQHVFHSYDQNNTAKEFAHYTNTSHLTVLKYGKGESDKEVIALPSEQSGDKSRNENGHETAVEPLPAIDGADSNSKDGRMLLLQTTERAQEAVARSALTMNNGTKPNTLQQTSSMTYSSEAIKLIPLLLEKDTYNNQANNDGRTLLHLASENSYVDVVKLLLAYKMHPLLVISGASKITVDIDHITALHYTVLSMSEEMA